MNLEKPPKSDLEDELDLGPEFINSLEFSETHTIGEGFESSSFDLHQDLKEAVESIPIGTTQRVVAESILEKFRNSISRKMQVAIAILSVASPLAGQAQEAQEIDQSPQEYSEIDFEESRKTERFLRKLHDGVWEDNHETLYIQFGDSGKEKKIATVEGAHGAMTFEHADLDGKQRQKLNKEIQTAWENFELKDKTMIRQHNHPVSLFTEQYNLSVEDLDSARSEETPIIVAPPSMLDLFAIDGHVAGSQYEIIGQVAEPSGTWTYVLVENHPVNTVIEELKNDWPVGQSADSENFDLVLEELLQNRGVQVASVENAIQEQLTFSYSDTFMNLWETTQNIRDRSAAGEDVSGLIDNYINLANQIGIAIEYEPHN